METKASVTYSLCPDCTACPAVEIYEEEVRIGEEGNQVRLKAEEWNLLVRAIQQGELRGLTESSCCCDCGCPCDCGGGCCV